MMLMEDEPDGEAAVVGAGDAAEPGLLGGAAVSAAAAAAAATRAAAAGCEGGGLAEAGAGGLPAAAAAAAFPGAAAEEEEDAPAPLPWSSSACLDVMCSLRRPLCVTQERGMNILGAAAARQDPHPS